MCIGAVVSPKGGPARTNADDAAAVKSLGGVNIVADAAGGGRVDADAADTDKDSDRAGADSEPEGAATSGLGAVFIRTASDAYFLKRRSSALISRQALFTKKEEFLMELC